MKKTAQNCIFKVNYDVFEHTDDKHVCHLTPLDLSATFDTIDMTYFLSDQASFLAFLANL